MTDPRPACTGIAPLTPLPTDNRPGLHTLAYRVGTHASFFESMLARLTSHAFDATTEATRCVPGAHGAADRSPLQGLRVRQSSDPSMALLDAWSCIGDLLTFYQERIANEGYLRTATERRSLEELAGLVGYQLKPGLSASTHLAFTVEQDSAPVIIPKGTPAQTIPGPGESPQTFETSESIEARFEWNEIRAIVKRHPNILLSNAGSIPSVSIMGTTTNLDSGDILLFAFEEGSAVKRVIHEVETDSEAGVTRITFAPGSISYERFEKALRPVVRTLRENWIGQYTDANVDSHIDDSCERFPVDRPPILDQPGLVSLADAGDAPSTLSLRTIYRQLEKALEDGRRDGLSSLDTRLSQTLEDMEQFRRLLNPHALDFSQLHGDIVAHRDNLFGVRPQVREDLKELMARAVTELAEVNAALKSVADAADDAVDTEFMQLADGLDEVPLASNRTAQLLKQFVELIPNESTKKKGYCTIAADIVAFLQPLLADPGDDPVVRISTALHESELGMLTDDIEWPDNRPDLIPQLLGVLELQKPTAARFESNADPDAARSLAAFPNAFFRQLLADFVRKPRVVTKTFELLQADIEVLRQLHDTVKQTHWQAAIDRLKNPDLQLSTEYGLDLVIRDEFAPFVKVNDAGDVDEAALGLTDFKRLALLIEPLRALSGMADKATVDRTAELIADQLEFIDAELAACIDAEGNADVERLVEAQQKLMQSVGELNSQVTVGLPQRSTCLALQETTRAIANVIAELTADRNIPGSFALQLSQALNRTPFLSEEEWPVRALVGPQLKRDLSTLRSIDFDSAVDAAAFASMLEVVSADAMRASQQYSSDYERLLEELVADEQGDQPSLPVRIRSVRTEQAKRARRELAEILTRASNVSEVTEVAEFLSTLRGIEAGTGHVSEIFQNVGVAIDLICSGKDPRDLKSESLRNSSTPESLRVKTRLIPDVVALYRSLGPQFVAPAITAQALADNQQGSAGLVAAIQRLNDGFAPESVEGNGPAVNPIGDLQVRLRSVLSSQSERVLFDAWRQQEPYPVGYRIFSFRDRLSLFGHSARPTAIPGDGAPPGICNPDTKHPPDASSRTLYLEREYPGILTGDYVIVETVGEDDDGEDIVRSHEVSSVNIFSLDAYCTSGKTTQLLLLSDWFTTDATDGEAVHDGKKPDFKKHIRKTTVRVGQVEHQVAPEPYPTPVGTSVPGADSSGLLEESNDQIEFEDLVDGLSRGQRLVVSGIRAVSRTATASAAQIKAVNHIWRAWPGERPHTRVTLEKPLRYPLIRDSVRVFANVVESTHGATQEDEIVGSGDAAKSFQRFLLNSPNVSHRPTVNGSAAQPELEVRINDVLWDHRENIARLYDDEAYTSRVAGNETTLQFGDGIHGVRLPTGIENVRAVYRTGIGRSGNVRRGQISQMPRPVLGVRECNNPVAGGGGVDPESVYQGRESTARYPAALGRLISLADYADFARNFGGVAKSFAHQSKTSARTTIHVYIALADDVPLSGPELTRNLRRALLNASSADVDVEVAPRELAVLILKAHVGINPRFRPQTVLAQAKRALQQRFSFDRAGFGETLQRSEAISTLQRIAGVEYVDVQKFGVIAESEVDPAKPPAANAALADNVASDPNDNDKRSLVKVDKMEVDNKPTIRLQPTQISYFPPTISEAITLTREGGPL